MSDNLDRALAFVLLSAWCVGHYGLESGPIAEIEQHDCYEQPAPPAPS
jgi:hypothetical protein